MSREVCCDHPQNGRTKTIGVSVILFTLGSGMGRRAAASFSLFTSVSFLVGAFIASVAGALVGGLLGTRIRSSPAEKTGRLWAVAARLKDVAHGAETSRSRAEAVARPLAARRYSLQGKVSIIGDANE